MFCRVLVLAALIPAGCKKNEPPPPEPPPAPLAPPPAAQEPEPAKPAEPTAAPATEPAPPTPPPAPATPPPAASRTALLDPAKLAERAPATYQARFVTSKGAFTIQVQRDWAPTGADRFYNLVKNGYFDDTRFFRAIKGFMVQFGINGDPKVNEVWREARINDDPVKESNKRGFVTFAKTIAPDSRTTQVFINFGDNTNLDRMGFAPFGKVVSGMDVVDALHTDYGEGAPSGMGPDEGRTQAEGNGYLDRDFPKLDQTKKATIVR